MVCGILGGGYTPWALSLLAFGGGVQMPNSRSIRVTCVALEIRGIDVLFDLRVGRKMTTFQLFFSVQETVGSPTGPDPENRVGDQDTGSPVRPVSSGLQVPGEPGPLSYKNKTSLVTFPRHFSFKRSFSYIGRDE